MTYWEIVLLALGLSMDAFAVSVCKGLAVKRAGLYESALTGVWFGGFQALMPTIGFFLGTTFSSYITKCDHWIAFVLLGIIGANMIKESFSKEENEEDASFALKTMFMMAVATSIDALAVGVTFAFLKVDVLLAVMTIGTITFALSAIGVKAGHIFGAKYKTGAERMGGIILICIGLKILIEHLIQHT
ncbi:MAG: manganese efflux pump [Clostridia bacterium]|nr:manganese efflux pump [Clostridia bacterium]